jgi:RNA polymerase sigma-70 factor (ECF subfamily)
MPTQAAVREEVGATGPEAVSPIDSETLFREYAGFVASFLHRLGAREADLEDLVQDVFMTAHRKGGYLPGAASPTTFLARIALEARLQSRRQSIRWQRSQSEGLSSLTLGADPATPESLLAMQRAAQNMQRALDTMEPGARAVFVLFELEGQSCDQIAAGLELKVGTVYSRLHTARKAFHAHVAHGAHGAQPNARRDREPSGGAR